MRVVIQHINKQRQMFQRWLAVQRRNAIAGAEALGLRLWQLLQRLRKVSRANAPLVPGLPLQVARREHLNTPQHRHAGGHFSHRHADARPMRVNGNGAVQRPGGRDSLASLLAGLGNLRMQYVFVGFGF